MLGDAAINVYGRRCGGGIVSCTVFYLRPGSGIYGAGAVVNGFVLNGDAVVLPELFGNGGPSISVLRGWVVVDGKLGAGVVLGTAAPCLGVRYLSLHPSTAAFCASFRLGILPFRMDSIILGSAGVVGTLSFIPSLGYCKTEPSSFNIVPVPSLFLITSELP